MFRHRWSTEKEGHDRSTHKRKTNIESMDHTNTRRKETQSQSSNRLLSPQGASCTKRLPEAVDMKAYWIHEKRTVSTEKRIYDDTRREAEKILTVHPWKAQLDERRREAFHGLLFQLVSLFFRTCRRMRKYHSSWFPQVSNSWSISPTSRPEV